jgi:hypothetical protein
MTGGLGRVNRIHWVVLMLYLVLAVGLTWPLVLHLDTHVPGSDTWAFDEYTFVWNMWWFRHALVDLGQNPLISTHTFYPLGIDLAFYTYNLFNALVSLPLQGFLSLPAISNLLFLGATALSGYGMFLLLEYLLRSDVRETARVRQRASRVIPYAAFLAGLIYAFGGYRLVYAAIGHYDKWSTQWIPLYALYLIRTVREPRWNNAVLAGVFLALALLCEMIFGVFLALLTLIILWFVWRDKRPGLRRGPLGRLLGRLGLLAAVAGLLYAPVLVQVLREMVGGYVMAGWGDATKLSADLVGLVTPTALHPLGLGGEWETTLRLVREGTSRFRDVNTLFLGWAGLVLAALGAFAFRHRLRSWIAAFVTFVVFSLGPLLQVNGRLVFDFDGLETSVPLPFILLHYLPVVKANRAPNRFSVVVMLALAVLAGYGAYWLLRRLRRPARRSVGFVLMVLVLFEHLAVPLPLTDAGIPAIYQGVAAEPGDFAILQLPMGWRNSYGVLGAENTRTQYYQTYHQKRLLSGNISRNPPFKFDYFQRQPILESLVRIETYGDVSPARREADRALADEFVQFYDLRFVAVAPGVPGRPPYVDTRAAAIAYVEEVLPVELIRRQGDWLLYRVRQRPLPDRLEVDLGTGGWATMALGEGWAADEVIAGATANWAVAQRARVFLPAQEEDYQLTLRAMPFDYPGAQTQSLELWLNGAPLALDLVLAPGWNEVGLRVPAERLDPGLNEVRLRFDHLAAPADVLPGDGQVGQTGVQAPVAIEVNSGAEFAFITVDNDDGSIHRDGYNLAVIHPRSGELLEVRGFDTTRSQDEASALAAFVAEIPDGYIVAVARQVVRTADGLAEGGDPYLTDAVAAAFRSLGGGLDPRQVSGAHSLVGVKGAVPGTALERSGEDGWLRVAPDRRTLGAAVDWLAWEVVPSP